MTKAATVGLGAPWMGRIQMYSVTATPAFAGNLSRQRDIGGPGAGRVFPMPLVGGLMAVLFSCLITLAPVHGAELASAVVRSGTAAETVAFDGVVEAVRQTAVAAQVSGAIVNLAVKAGDAVTAGQVLLRIDTAIEVDYYRHGGIMPYVLRELLAAA